MAANNITPTVTPLDGSGRLVHWHMIADSTGEPVRLPGFELVSAQAFGTFDTSGTVALEGSNGGSTFGALLDSAGSALSFTAAAVKTTLTPTVDVHIYALFRVLT